MNILLTLQFDGSAYCGFQVQQNGRSVCAVVQDALQAVLGTRPPVKGCGRTDAGVHALGYALSFFADTGIPLHKLPLALNSRLPADVRVIAARQAPESFHARYSAHTKTYCYRIRLGAVDSPFDAAWCCRLPGPLDLAAMRAAAKDLCGTHDFTAFCAAGSDLAARGDTVRTVTRCEVSLRQDAPGGTVNIEVTADGFLYNMVRIIAGTLVRVGQGRIPANAIPAILKSRSRRNAGPTMPARGLFLKEVFYPPEVLDPPEASGLPETPGGNTAPPQGADCPPKSL